MVWLGRLVGCLLVAGCAVGMIALALGHVDPHDGSCTAVLARNLAATGEYGFTKYGRFELWPVEATTGPTIVVPIAIAYGVAGEGPFVANVACALVVLGLSIRSLGWRRVLSLAIAWSAALLAVLGGVEVWKLASFGARQP